MQGLGSWVLFVPILLFIVSAVVMCVCFKKRTSAMMTNARCLNIAVGHKRISIRELADLCDLTEVSVIGAIDWGKKRGMPITIEDGYFVRLADPSAWQKGKETVVYLVICPHCSHKNEQGLVECENCGGPL